MPGMLDDFEHMTEMSKYETSPNRRTKPLVKIDINLGKEKGKHMIIVY